MNRKTVKCAKCGDVIKVFSKEEEKYIKECPLAGEKWIEEIIDEHEACDCCKNPYLRKENK